MIRGSHFAAMGHGAGHKRGRLTLAADRAEAISGKLGVEARVGRPHRRLI